MSYLSMLYLFPLCPSLLPYSSYYYYYPSNPSIPPISWSPHYISKPDKPGPGCSHHRFVTLAPGFLSVSKQRFMMGLVAMNFTTAFFQCSVYTSSYSSPAS